MPSTFTSKYRKFWYDFYNTVYIMSSVLPCVVSGYCREVDENWVRMEMPVYMWK